MMTNAGIVTICIFRSTPQHIEKFAKSHISSDIIIFGDKKGSSYEKFKPIKSIGGGLIGMMLEMKKNTAKYRPYLSMAGQMKDGRGAKLYLPADFMINEHGIIVDLFRSTNLTDQMPFDRVELFIPKDKRCKCNRHDCISSHCRLVNKEMKEEAEKMIFVGRKSQVNRTIEQLP